MHEKSRIFFKDLIFQQVLSCFVCGQLKSKTYFPFSSLQKAGPFCFLTQNTLTSAMSLPCNFVEELWTPTLSSHQCVQVLRAKTPGYD